MLSQCECLGGGRHPTVPLPASHNTPCPPIPYRWQTWHPPFRLSLSLHTFVLCLAHSPAASINPLKLSCPRVAPRRKTLLRYGFSGNYPKLCSCFVGSSHLPSARHAQEAIETGWEGW